MNILQYLEDAAEGMEILAQVEGDAAALTPGSTNTFPCSIHVGSKNGKAVRLTGVTLAVDP